MRRITSILLTVTLLAAVFAGSLGARAQSPKAETRKDAPAWKDFASRMRPPQAKAGTAAERRAAWEGLTPAEQQKVKERFQQILEGAIQKAQKERPAADDVPDEPTALFSAKGGLRRPLKAKAGKKSGALTPVEPGRGQFRAARAPGGRAGMMFVRASAARTAAYAPPQSGCWKSIEQFVRDFYLGGLVRQPSPYELNYWVNRLTQAQAQGMEQLWVEGRELGYAIFKSQEYADRARADADFVYDLYRAWLQRDPDADGYSNWQLTLQNGYSRDHVIDGFAYSIEFRYYKIEVLCNAASTDSDADTLPDLFESRVADFFTPYYHVSAGDPDNFSTFADSTDQVVAQRFGQSVVSHYRVVPAGFAVETATGQLVSLLRVDYLALLDHDSGLVNGFFCGGIGAFGIPLGGLLSHNLDNERSAVLLAAPVSDYSYNLDPAAYSAYTYMTVAHEDVGIFEQLNYLSFYPPVPPNWHIELWQSLSKHGTYPGDPDYLPLVPWYIIYSVFDEIDNLYYWGYISIYQYFSLYFQAETFFYTCVVERFHEQGGQFAFLRINVGEPDTPVNGSRFISAGALRQKLLKPFFF
jgi:hypothetical protein